MDPENAGSRYRVSGAGARWRELGHLAQAQILLDAEAGVFQNAHREAATEVAAGVDRDGDGHVAFRVPQGKVTAGL